MGILLTPGRGNHKLAKGSDLNVEVAILHLAPNTISGHNTCSMASVGCAKSCLYSAGHGAYSNTQTARINKTKWLFEAPNVFISQLVLEVAALERRACKLGKTPAIRLNGTSDILWESIGCERDGVRHANIMLAFPNVVFYDYTKVISRLGRTLPSNYHLTFSLSESNDKHAKKALDLGFNVAVVMRGPRKEPMPATWGGFPVIEGDSHDFRFLDPKGGHVVALTTKGIAGLDRTGFVRDKSGALDLTRIVQFASQSSVVVQH